MYSLVRTLCVLLVASFSVLAQDAPPIEDVFTASPEQLLAQAKAIEAEEDDSVVVLFREFVLKVDSDGSGRSTYKLIYQIRKEDAVESWGAVSSTWAPWRQAQPQIRARVVAPDGSVHDLDPATIVEVADDNASNSIYTDDKRLQAPLPAIEPGSVVEREIVVENLRPAFDGGRAGKWYFDSAGPTRLARMVIDAASDVPVSHILHLADGAGPVVSEQDGRKQLVFEMRDLPSDATAPPNLPSDRARWPSVAYSTGGSWQAVARRYRERLEEQLAAGPLERVDVPAGLSKKELAAALKAKLHEQVRYTGIEFGESAYIPHPPSETMERRYGDCKDTATVLIGMLRSHGIDATIALLSAGSGRDIDPETPGMGRFNHAIVYVPDDEEPLWIDTTAEFSRVDELPLSDQGRLALIADAATTELTLTPLSSSADNRAVETRVVTLPNDGNGTLVETTETWGSIEAYYRSSFHGITAEEKLRENFESYVKDVYDTEEITSISLSESADLSERHKIVLSLEEVGRAVSDPDEAVVVIPRGGLLNRLPNGLLSDPEEDEEKRVDDFIVYDPHTVEWRYRIRPALGFEPREAPEDEDRPLGVARYTASYEATEDGGLEATLRFDSGPRRLTPEQYEETRKALREFSEEDALLLWFDQRGETLMSAGRYGEALTEFRKLREAEPDEVQHRIRTALALLGTGLGEPARTEARAATEADPESSAAWVKLGWVLEHDLIGRRFEKGWDPAAAEAAYRKAIELDPENTEARASLAILFEHVPRGERYGPKARLDEAIAEYRALLEVEENETFEQNLLAALLRAQRFEELLRELKERGRDDLPYMEMAARAVTKGPEDALRWANRSINSNHLAQQSSNAVRSLMFTRNYQQVAALMRGMAAGAGGNAQTLAQAKMFESMERYEDVELPDDDPRSVGLKFLIHVLSGDAELDQIFAMMSKNAARARSDEETVRKLNESLYTGYGQMRAQNLPVAFSLDVLVAGRDEPAEGNDESGYQTAIRMMGRELLYFVVREDGAYRLLDTSSGNDSNFSESGFEALRRIEAGDLEGAGVLLDWVREHISAATSDDDPLAGKPFLKFWTKGDPRDEARMRTAAAVLLSAESIDGARALELLAPLRKKAKSKDARVQLDRALLQAHRNLKQWEEAAEVARRIWKAHPDSDTAIYYLSGALQRLGAWDELDDAFDARLRKDPKDAYVLRLRLNSEARRLNLDGVAAAREKLEALGELKPRDLSTQAMAALAAGKLDSAAVETMEEAVRRSGETPSVETLQRLAAVYAESGQAGPARQVQAQLLKSQVMEVPDDGAWFVYGRIAEELGELDTARSYYQRVKAPQDKTFAEHDYYAFAQRRLAKL